MGFFTNKHVIASMIIAPILAVLAWFAVGYLVEEKPQQIISGGTYTLNERPSCRWESGNCELRNSDVKFSLTAEGVRNNIWTINLESSILLDEILVALADTRDEKNTTPIRMLRKNDYNFLLNLDNIQNNQFLQFIFTVDDSMFYATVPTVWIFKEDLIYDQLKQRYNDN